MDTSSWIAYSALLVGFSSFAVAALSARKVDIAKATKMTNIYDLDVGYLEDPVKGWYGSGKIMLGPFKTQSEAANACRNIISAIGPSDEELCLTRYGTETASEKHVRNELE
jgi:hypothetical protein